MTPFNGNERSAAEVVVPTGINTARMFWMGHLLRASYPVMVAGPTGVGKRALVRSALHTLQVRPRTHSDGFN